MWPDGERTVCLHPLHPTDNDMGATMGEMIGRVTIEFAGAR
jgi:hypothetical protein